MQLARQAQGVVGSARSAFLPLFPSFRDYRETLSKPLGYLYPPWALILSKTCFISFLLESYEEEHTSAINNDSS